MQKSLPDNLLSLYDQNIKSSIDNYKKTESEAMKAKSYQYYYSKSLTEINSINTLQLKAECNAKENQVNARVKQLNQIKQKLIDSNSNTNCLSIILLPLTPDSFELNYQQGSNMALSATNSKLFTEKYSKEIQSLITQLNDLLSKIDHLSNSPFDSMKKAKSEYDDNKCELILQPLINSMIEKRKYYNLVIKEKESKLKTVEEKKTTFSENKMKIERLTKEFNENSERMTNELKQNEIIQKELEHLIAVCNKNQPSTMKIPIPEDQLNIITSMKKKLQIAMVNVSDKMAMISCYQKNINASGRIFVYFIIKIGMNLLLKKRHYSLRNEYEDNLNKTKTENELLVKEYNEQTLLLKEVTDNEEKMNQTLTLLNNRLTKLESIAIKVAG